MGYPQQSRGGLQEQLLPHDTLQSKTGPIVISVLTPRGKTRRILSMRKRNDHEIRKIAPNLA